MKTKILSVLSILFMILIFTGAVEAQTNDNSAQATDKGETTIKDEPLKILKKAFPRTDGRCSERSGAAAVRVTFHNSGKVTDVQMITASNCDYFNNRVLEESKKIKFKPQIKDGEAVTVMKVVEYNFRSY